MTVLVYHYQYSPIAMSWILSKVGLQSEGISIFIQT